MFTTVLSIVAVSLVFAGVIAVFNGPIRTALVALEERCDRWEDPLGRPATCCEAKLRRREAKEKS